MDELWTAFVFGAWTFAGSMAWDETRARRISQSLKRGLRMAGMALKEASGAADRDQGNVTRELACEHGLGRTLASQDDDALACIAVALYDEFGPTKSARIAAELERAASADKHMAHMEAPQHREKVSA